MNRMSLRTLKWIRNIIVMIGIVGGLIIWLNIPPMILNNRFVHVGNGKYGSKIGLLILLVLPFFSFLDGIEREEIHTDDEAERVRLEDEMRRVTVKTQIRCAIGESIVVFIVMLTGILLCGHTNNELLKAYVHIVFFN